MQNASNIQMQSVLTNNVIVITYQRIKQLLNGCGNYPIHKAEMTGELKLNAQNQIRAEKKKRKENKRNNFKQTNKHYRKMEIFS